MYGPGFSLVDMTLSVFFRDAQVDAASASASVSNGSRPLGKAPAWRETTKVSGPAATAPVDVVAQPLTKISEMARSTTCCKCFGNIKMFGVLEDLRQETSE